MSTLKELAVDHPYYCSDNNYYSNDAGAVFETATEFLDEFEDADIDMNLCFRFDVKPRSESGEETERYQAEIFMMHQRKGIFSPIYIKHINEKEAIRLKEYLKCHYAHLIKMWEPISTLGTDND